MSSREIYDAQDGIATRESYGFRDPVVKNVVDKFVNNDNPNWVHVSYVSPEENRNRCLKAYKEKGKTKYIFI